MSLSVEMMSLKVETADELAKTLLKVSSVIPCLFHSEIVLVSVLVLAIRVPLKFIVYSRS